MVLVQDCKEEVVGLRGAVNVDFGLVERDKVWTSWVHQESIEVAGVLRQDEAGCKECLPLSGSLRAGDDKTDLIGIYIGKNHLNDGTRIGCHRVCFGGLIGKR